MLLTTLNNIAKKNVGIARKSVFTKSDKYIVIIEEFIIKFLHKLSPDFIYRNKIKITRNYLHNLVRLVNHWKYFKI